LKLVVLMAIQSSTCQEPGFFLVMSLSKVIVVAPPLSTGTKTPVSAPYLSSGPAGKARWAQLVPSVLTVVTSEAGTPLMPKSRSLPPDFTSIPLLKPVQALGELQGRAPTKLNST